MSSTKINGYSHANPGSTSKLGADYGIEGRLIGNTPTPESPAPDGRWIEVPTNRPVFVALVADRFDVSVAGTHAAARWEHRRTAGYRIRATYKPTRMDEKADPAGWQCLGRCPFEMLASEWIETDLYQRYFVGEAIRNPRQDGRRRIDSEGR